MDEIKVNEEMTKMAIMAHDVAKLKQDDPEMYEAMMREVINNAKCSLESELEGRDKFTAMLYKSVMEAISKRLYDDPFALIEIEHMVQEIDHKKTEDRES